MLSWLLGSFISAEWSESGVVLVYLLPSLAVVLGFARVLNVLQLREDHASMLGVDVEKVKILLVVAATLATAAAVSVQRAYRVRGLDRAPRGADHLGCGLSLHPAHVRHTWARRSWYWPIWLPGQ